VSATNGAEPVEGLFSLDALERDDTKDPFPFEHGGRVWHVGHPDDVDYRIQQRIADAGTNAALLEQLLGDQYPEFAALPEPLPAWKCEKLFKAMGDYYGISPPESQASPASSNRQERRSRRTSSTTTGPGSATSRRAG
jgi:hypothetical protein